MRLLKGLPNRGLPIRFQDKDSDGQLPAYLHLVSAHICMAIEAIDEAVAKDAEQYCEGVDLSHVALKKRYNADYGNKHLVHELWQIDEIYVSHVTQPKNFIAEYLRSKGLDVSGSQAEVAWWLLMLRGLAWGISVCWDDVLYGPPIPSSLYGNKTPIWIT